MTELYLMLLGVCVATSVAIGRFFYGFWRRSGDSLFLLFAIAFCVLGAQWAVTGVTPQGEGSHLIYIPRLLAYALIIAGIVKKNVTGPAPPA